MRQIYRLFRYPELWSLTLAAFFTRFWQLLYPNDIVFDEIYFREFASNYLSGEYFFDIHPPLVKLMLAGIGGLFGFSTDEVAGSPDATAVMRLLPALAGALLVPLVYAIARQMGMGKRIATLGGLLVLLDNALLVESRFVLMDSFLLLFGLGALSCYLMLRRSTGKRRWLWLVLMAAAIGALISTKWSGLAVVGLLAIAWLAESIKQRVDWRRMLVEASTVIAIIATIYIASFAVHFALLPRSGEGDAFMSLKFQSTLVDNQHYDETVTMPFLEKFIELNSEMYGSQSSLESVEHPYASKWYDWPLMVRPVYYWQSSPGADGLQGHIYLLGNPVVWWGVVLFVVVALIALVSRSKLIVKNGWLLVFLLAGYLINWLPFAFINRPMFMYHYLFSLLFGILIACVILSAALDWISRRYDQEIATRLYVGVCVAVLGGFLYFLPVSYGWPLAEADLMRYMWSPNWR